MKGIWRNKDYERRFINLITKLGFDAHRIAGSGVGKEAFCDCIISFNKQTYAVEVKTTKDKIFYMRKDVVEQLKKMIDFCERNDYVPLLAVRFKYKGWNVFEVKNFENIVFNKEVVLDENCRQDFIIA